MRTAAHEVLGAPEGVRHIERYRLDREGRQPARLYISTAPSVAPRRGTLLNLTVRGGLSGDLGTFLDDAREDNRDHVRRHDDAGVP
jgi:hypothetical protein